MKWIITILIILLLTTNAFWLYSAVDNGVTVAYRDQQIHELDETRKQLMASLPEIANQLHKEEIIEITKKYTKLKAYDKNGCSWVGWLGLKFNENNKLQSVSPVWSYGDENPCLTSF
ncbi:hypothetical protein LMJ53_09235 [Rheinheimera sp. UJ51]|uniref:hypothetical protein n=1 Tax=Rheinheimera sp. UJ51 TaxID=2892446 RepID=UPI001E5E4FBD|nr:hypothetical protein [Rheinheimera sp. UJ51]MCC5451904.1 hypothetical protein [Rheinheimera sp. UJ51]